MGSSVRTSSRMQRAFTLLEVLVALAVLSVALSAAIQSISQNTRNASYLRERTLAHWVGMNKVTEWQSGVKKVSLGKNTGSEDMAGHEWHWSVNVVESGVENVWQMQVEVRRDRSEKQALSNLMALVEKP